MAQAMAVMTQVRVAALRYGLSVAEYKQVEQSAAVDARLLAYARSASAARVEGELEVIRNEARALLSEYQRHIAYANAQAAWGRIYNSVGFDIEVPPAQADLNEIAATIDRSLESWRRTTFIDRPGTALQPVSMHGGEAATMPAVNQGLNGGTPAGRVVQRPAPALPTRSVVPAPVTR